MAEKIEKILVDITGLTRYHDNLKVVLENKATAAADDATAKANAAKAAAIEAASADATAKADAAQSAAIEAASADATAKADAAQSAAKTYADNLVKDAEGNVLFDAAGSAADAQSAAETYAAGLNTAMDDRVAVLEGHDVYVADDVTSAIATAAAGALTSAQKYADDKDSAMDARVADLEAIDHEKLASDASAAAVATVLDGAPEKFDTLKEVAQWIADSESAATAADLVTRVSALESIDHDAYVAADETVLASANSYADGLASNYDTVGSAAQALTDAKDYVDSKFVFATEGEIDALFA